MQNDITFPNVSLALIDKYLNFLENLQYAINFGGWGCYPSSLVIYFSEISYIMSKIFYSHCMRFWFLSNTLMSLGPVFSLNIKCLK